VTPFETNVSFPVLLGMGCNAMAAVGVVAVPDPCHKDVTGAVKVNGAPVLKLKIPPIPQFSVNR